MTKKALILGGTSAISQAVAKKLAAKGWSITLVGRDKEKLDIVKADLKARSEASCDSVQLDFCDYEQVDIVLNEIFKSGSKYDLAFVSYGTLFGSSVSTNGLRFSQTGN